MWAVSDTKIQNTIMMMPIVTNWFFFKKYIAVAKPDLLARRWGAVKAAARDFVALDKLVWVVDCTGTYPSRRRGSKNTYEISTSRLTIIKTKATSTATPMMA